MPELALVLADVFVNALTLEDVQVRQGNGSPDRVASPGVAVEERVGAVLERFEQAVTGDHGSHGGVAAGHALGAGDDVRRNSEAIHRKHVADPAECSDGFVGDHQDVVLIADLAHALEVSGWGRKAAPGVLNRLNEHCSHAVRSFELDGLGDAVCRP